MWDNDEMVSKWLHCFNRHRWRWPLEPPLVLIVHSDLGERMALTISGLGICFRDLDYKRQGDPS